MKQINITLAVVFLCITALALPLWASVVEYELIIDYKEVSMTGRPVQAMTINGSIPGPTLRFREGDFARIHVQNRMDVETSIHWHGILLPNFQDGVPYVTTPPILPGTTFTYEFPLKHAGTYWYHSHTGLQEQRGVFGSIVIEPEHELMAADVDYVVVLSDWTDEDPDEILRTLKSGNDYYSLKKGTMQSLAGAVKTGAVQNVFRRSWMRMPSMDISDIAYDRFLVNGKPSDSLPAPPGQRVKLRVINAAASSYFYLQYAEGPMKVIAADGPPIEPVSMDRLLIAVAETYDLIITVPEAGSAEFRATAQDGSGFTSLHIGSGEVQEAPDIPAPNLYTMHGQRHGSSGNAMQGVEHKPGHAMSPAGDGAKMMKMPMNERPGAPYDRLKSRTSTALNEDLPMREIRLELTGDMERYVWSLNGKTLNEADVVRIKKGENIRFVMINKTMMHHPMHLHGHFFRVVNKHGDYSPLKHTFDVPPMGKRVIEFYANEEKDWFFHCHMLYHMKTGMARIVHYEGTEMDPRISSIRPQLFRDHWYAWGNASFLTQMTEGQIVAANTRNTLRGTWEHGWQEDYEALFTYERYFNRFFQVFGGGVLTDGEQEDRFIAGIRYLLPFLVESSIWIDTEGDVRVILEKQLQLTDRLYAFGDFQYDTESDEEWAAGGGWTINKHISLIGQYHSEYKGGIGVNIRY